MDKRYRLTVRLDSDMADALRRLAADDRRSVQATVEHAISSYLRHRRALASEVQDDRA